MELCASSVITSIKFTLCNLLSIEEFRKYIDRSIALGQDGVDFTVSGDFNLFRGVYCGI